MRYVHLLLTVVFVSAAMMGEAAVRETTKLDTGWRFKQGESSGAEQAGYDDSSWQSLAIPHNWGWEQAQNGENYQRGPGWYRRELNISAPQAGRRYYVKFEAAGSVADVYLNGKSVGQHRGAFGAFCFEVTSQLSTNGGKNVLAVRVSNAAEPDVAPLSGECSRTGTKQL